MSFTKSIDKQVVATRLFLTGNKKGYPYSCVQYFVFIKKYVVFLVSMKTKEEHVGFWVAQAEDDWKAVFTLFNGQHFLQSFKDAQYLQ